MDSNHILHMSKDQQICFMGGPEMWQTNLRWRTATILKNRDISATVWPILTKFNTGMHLGPLMLAAVKISGMAYGQHLENCNISAAILRISLKFSL